MAQTAFEKYASGSKMTDVELPNTNMVRIDSLLDFADFSDGEWHKVRLWPGVHALATMWLDVQKKDGNTVQIPRTILNFDIEKASFDTSKRCPYYENRDYVTCRGEPGGQLNIHYYVNVLDRELQNNEPRKTKITSDEQKSGFKAKESKSWTPIRVARFPKTVIEKLLKLQELNRIKGDPQELSDPNTGRDVYVLFNRDARNPANMWDAQLDPDGPSKLSKKEKSYLMYDIGGALETMQQQQTVDDAEKWMTRHLEALSGQKKGAGKGKKKDKAKTDKSKSDAETNVSVNELLGKSKKKKKDSKESNSPKAPKKDKKDKKLDPENVVDVKPKKKKKKDQSVDEKPDKKADKNDKSSKNDSDDKAKKKKSKNTGDDTVKNGKNKKNKDTGKGKNGKKPKYDFKF